MFNNLFRLLLVLSFALSFAAHAQTGNNVYVSYEEFVRDKPSKKALLWLQESNRHYGDKVDRIDNYQIDNIQPPDMITPLTDEIWGVKFEGGIYINANPYSGVVGYNHLVGKGYFSYFEGEPAFKKKLQLKTGLIGPHEERFRSRCRENSIFIGGLHPTCRVAYVILPGGEVRVLTPDYLAILINDNPELSAKLKQMQLDDLYDNASEMFDILKEYNKTKQ